MATVESLATYRLTKMRERVERLEKALIEREAELAYRRTNRGAWFGLAPDMVLHYRMLAENELVREGLVRPKNVREMER